MLLLIIIIMFIIDSVNFERYFHVHEGIIASRNKLLKYLKIWIFSIR